MLPTYTQCEQLRRQPHVYYRRAGRHQIGRASWTRTLGRHNRRNQSRVIGNMVGSSMHALPATLISRRMHICQLWTRTFELCELRNVGHRRLGILQSCRRNRNSCSLLPGSARYYWFGRIFLSTSMTNSANVDSLLTTSATTDQRVPKSAFWLRVAPRPKCAQLVFAEKEELECVKTNIFEI